jgi:hypothetical protein
VKFLVVQFKHCSDFPDRPPCSNNAAPTRGCKEIESGCRRPH